MDKRRNVILIVDDTPENLRVLGELLESDGHEVRVATSGERGIEIARGLEVDLILLDIMMPQMDGYEVCSRLKRDPTTREIPIIFLTALDSPDDEARGLKLGAVDYITKPFKLELVRSRVANQLALHNARLELHRYNTKLEDLVAERSRELAEAHRRLLTVDSAKYDFLQMIYQELWSPGRGIIDLSRRVLGILDAEGLTPEGLASDYDDGESRLLETINNALLLSSSHKSDSSPRLPPVRLDALVSGILERRRADAEALGIRLPAAEAAPGLAVAAPVAGDLDLLFQALNTVVHAALLMARSGTSLKLKVVEDDAALELTWELEVSTENAVGLESLFAKGTRFHASTVGRRLGLAIPLAAKIFQAIGGSVAVAPGSKGHWTIRVGLPLYTRRLGAKITL